LVSGWFGLSKILKYRPTLNSDSCHSPLHTRNHAVGSPKEYLWGLTYEDCEETLHKYLITVFPPPPPPLSLLTDGHGKRVEKVEEFG